MKKTLAFFFLLSSLCIAQDCPTIYGAFAGYSPNASPKISGGGLIATLLPGTSCNPAILQIYSYTQYVESPVKLSGVWTLQQTISTGIAAPVYKLPFGEFWALGTVGAKVTGSSSTVGLGSTYGGGISIPVKKYKIFPAYQRVNGQNQILIAFLF